MTQINELQGRITTALDRIAQGLDSWDPQAAQSVATAEVAALEERLATTEAALAEAQSAAAAAEAQLAEGGDTSSLEEQITDLNTSLDMATEARETAETALATLQGEADQAKVDVEALTAQVAELQTQNAQGATEVQEQAQAEIETLKAQIVELETQGSNDAAVAVERAQAEAEAAMSEAFNLRAELEDLKAQTEAAPEAEPVADEDQSEKIAALEADLQAARAESEMAREGITAAEERANMAEAQLAAAQQLEGEPAGEMTEGTAEVVEDLGPRVAELETELQAAREGLTAAEDRAAQAEAQLQEAQAAEPAPVSDAASAETGEESGEDTGDMAALREELEDEKMANAQLEERLKTLRKRLEEAEAAPAPEVTEDEAPVEDEAAAVEPVSEPVAGPDLAALDAEMHQLRAANAELETSISALREANAQGVGDPHLINKAMLAELESLRASRKVEAAEAQAVLGALEPLLSQAAGEA